MKLTYVVSYDGFLQRITRTFPTYKRAEQWARQVGVYERASIAGVAQ